MKTLTIEGQIRTDLGKKHARLLRREESVPCVLYGDGENVHFSAPIVSFRDLVYTPAFHTIDLSLAGKNYSAIVKDIQFHPVTDAIEHVDFLKLVPGKIVQTDLPVRLEGVSVGVREGGKIKLKVRKLTVKTTPEHLVETVDVNITSLEMGKSFRVGQISLEGVEILNNPGLPIVTCEVPRAMRGLGTEAEGEEGKEGEAAPAAAEGEAAPAAKAGAE